MTPMRARYTGTLTIEQIEKHLERHGCVTREQAKWLIARLKDLLSSSVK